MRKTLMIALVASALASPALAKPRNEAGRGLAPVNVPVVTRSDYAFDAAAPDGSLPSSEMARLDAWLSGLNLGYGDRVYVDGPAGAGARYDVARVVGQYGLLLSDGAPVTQGAVAPGTVRVVVSRSRASVPGCPDWSQAAQPNFGNYTMSNFGCAVNGNMAAMIADPQDFVWGREAGTTDSYSATRAIQSYRKAVPTGEGGLKEVSSKGGK